LVIVGKRGWLYDDIVSAPTTYATSDRVKFLEYIPDTDLSVLYRNALCFALPSLYEGFGFPVLEAMTYGCPVVVSRTSSLPEIAGEAGIYVDPESIESIAQGLETALNERRTESGKERVDKGRKQVEKFSWERAAQKTLAILEEVGSRKGK
jgi:glycosyltransferase involved in cell wall biosynthesis